MTNPRPCPLKSERLAFLRSSIQRVRPWQWATGPKTAAGKARSRMNALKHGLRSAEVLVPQRELAEMSRQIRAILKAERAQQREAMEQLD